jgi:hypothetical protein
MVSEQMCSYKIILRELTLCVSSYGHHTSHIEAAFHLPQLGP